MLRRRNTSRWHIAVVGGVAGIVLALGGSSVLAAPMRTSVLNPFTLQSTAVRAPSVDSSKVTRPTMRQHTIRLPARPPARSAFRPLY
jgi:hypothetical protein